MSCELKVSRDVLPAFLKGSKQERGLNDDLESHPERLRSAFKTNLFIKACNRKLSTEAKRAAYIYVDACEKKQEDRWMVDLTHERERESEWTDGEDEIVENVETKRIPSLNRR